MNVVIIRYNAGNIQSVDFALRRLGVYAEITSDHHTIRKADKVIFPGVGEASTTMKFLRDNRLDQVIVELTRPVLGICLGLQLMCSYSEEGDTHCLGIFPEKVRRFRNPETHPLQAKIPHMGWNTIATVKGPLFDSTLEGRHMYFVHSYYAEMGSHTSAVTDYIEPFSAALQKDNFFAVQFHPEKSGVAGSVLLQSFLKL